MTLEKAGCKALFLLFLKDMFFKREVDNKRETQPHLDLPILLFILHDFDQADSESVFAQVKVFSKWSIIEVAVVKSKFYEETREKQACFDFNR